MPITRAEAIKLIVEDPDFIWSKRFNYSLIELKQRYPSGCPDHIAASVLMITEDELNEFYEGIVEQLRKIMGVELYQD